MKTKPQKQYILFKDKLILNHLWIKEYYPDTYDNIVKDSRKEVKPRCGECRAPGLLWADRENNALLKIINKMHLKFNEDCFEQYRHIFRDRTAHAIWKKARDFKRRLTFNDMKYVKMLKENKKDFESLSLVNQQLLISWITNNLRKIKTINPLVGSSYGLKHMFSNDSDVYIHNEAFKHAMLLCEFEVQDKTKLNWYFNISRKSPAFMKTKK